MKTVGIVGGISPESTIDYYQKIISKYCKKDASGNYPQIIINSINMHKMLSLMQDNQYQELVEFLVSEIDSLRKAGADFCVLASNTAHIVFDQLRQQASIPLISIVEATYRTVIQQQCSQVGLFGTKFTMKGGFYNEILSKNGITVITPNEKDQDYIHQIYMDELVKGIFRDDTRENLIQIAETLTHENDIQGLILGGTELPLILKQDDIPTLCLFDTAEIHTDELVNDMCSA
ncbi:hypothetical protein A9Q99_06020 [Gammaproteobacteria bacterium 45_16_T64]|nr:hypothetical protein A9Q99_06020 [Gammaproteobacteria bacterium 45_16_T64]